MQYEINELHKETFNQFIIHGLVQNVIGRLSIDRLIMLDDSSSLNLLDDYAREALIDCDSPDTPIAPGLRKPEDFVEGQECFLKTPYFRSLEPTLVHKIMEKEVQVIFPDSTKATVPVDYPGLVNKDDYDYYVTNRPGRGSVYSSIGFNLELTRMMSVLGLINYDNEEIIRKTKRLFEVSAKEYRHRKF